MNTVAPWDPHKKDKNGNGSKKDDSKPASPAASEKAAPAAPEHAPSAPVVESAPSPVASATATATAVATKAARLGDLLIAKDLINPSQLAEALLQQGASGKRLGSLLVELGALDERDLARALADQNELEVVDLRKVTPEPDAVTKLPEITARTLNAVPLKIENGTLQIAIDDPSNAEVMQQLATAAGMPLKAYV
ncbi:MAG: hypothetical protein ABR552_07495, partial [Actinomycetota bacterium]